MHEEVCMCVYYGYGYWPSCCTYMCVLFNYMPYLCMYELLLLLCVCVCVCVCDAKLLHG